MRRTNSRTRPAFLLLPLLLLAGCGEDEITEPPRLDVSVVAGLYSLTQLSFDPQGSLPAADLLPALNTVPTLNLTTSLQAQILVQDPVTSLVFTINGTFQTTEDGIRLQFPEGSGNATLLLPSPLNLTFDEQAKTLTFSGAVQGGIPRDRLIELVPALAEEQLLDPVPGTLVVQFTKN